MRAPATGILIALMAADTPTVSELPVLIVAPASCGGDQPREQLDGLRRLLRVERLKPRLDEHRLGTSVGLAAAMAGRRCGSVRATRSLRGPPGAIVPLARNGRGLVLGMVLNIISRPLHAVVCRRKTAGLRDGPQPTNESTIPGGCQGLLAALNAALNAAHRSLTRRPTSRPASFTLEGATGLRLRSPRQARNPCFTGDYRGSRSCAATSRQRSSATTSPTPSTNSSGSSPRARPGHVPAVARAELTADGWRQLASRGSDWSVGRRSLVSSSSARLASSWSARPRARATRSATSQVGLDVPRSRPRIEVASRSAASARDSWVSPISSRRRRTARPRATCGVWLMRTP